MLLPRRCCHPRAGIVLDDELVAVDGVELKSGDARGQCAVRDAIDAAEDRVMKIRVRHEGAERDVELRAEPVLPAYTASAAN